MTFAPVPSTRSRPIAYLEVAAVQSIGERSVVYRPVKGEEGKFVQRHFDWVSG